MIGTVRKMVEFLESCIPVFPDDEDLDTAIKKGRELIDQLRETLPVAWVDDGGQLFWKDKPLPDGTDFYVQQQPAQHWHDLYKAKCQELHDERARLGAQIEALEHQPAQQRTWVGLTDEQIDDVIWRSHRVESNYAGWATDQRRIWARAIEAAHGIAPQGSDNK